MLLVLRVDTLQGKRENAEILQRITETFDRLGAAKRKKQHDYQNKV